MGFVDQLVNYELDRAHKALSSELNSNVIFFYGPMNFDTPNIFNQAIDNIKDKKKTLSLVLTTGGGLVEPVERTVEIIRNSFTYVNFIVPDYAMSAGTIFCMSGDKIYMDISSSLGPIDPQVQNKDGVFVPAMGYLEQFDKLVKKAADGTISPAEVDMLRRFDLGELNRYEQARNLTVTLLRKWLVKYKFKNWKVHRTTPGLKGQPVAPETKESRAEQIAKDLGDITLWHSHQRHICIDTLKKTLRLKIEDYTKRKNLKKCIAIYHGLAMDYIHKNGYSLFIHNGDNS